MVSLLSPMAQVTGILSSYLLERNRWNGKGPSLLVSDWVELAAEAGFAGLDIWAPHLLLASRSEWEAIRDKSGEADLPVTSLLAQISGDVSDKSRRQLGELAEAADFFGISDLRFHWTDATEKSEQAPALVRLAEALPRGVRLSPLLEQAAEAEEARLWREELGDRLGVSANPFALERETLEDLFRDFEGAVNLGVRVHKGAQFKALREAAELPALAAWLRRRRFEGAWILECTRGVGAPGEDADSLFDSAEEDLNFLIEEWEKTARTVGR